eukprot:4684902-Amphidinium_carterae.3
MLAEPGDTIGLAKQLWTRCLGAGRGLQRCFPATTTAKDRSQTFGAFSKSFASRVEQGIPCSGYSDTTALRQKFANKVMNNELHLNRHHLELGGPRKRLSALFDTSHNIFCAFFLDFETRGFGSVRDRVRLLLGLLVGPDSGIAFKAPSPQATASAKE